MDIHTALYIASAFAVSAAVTAIEIPYLKKLHAGQSIREDGPEAHKAKSGTPTMGGISILLSVILCAVIFAFCTGASASYAADTAVIIAVALIYGAIGFADDYIKVVKKRNLGLTAKQKLVCQTAGALLLAVYGFKYHSSLYLPFAAIDINIGWLYIPFIVFVVIAMTNAVNLTDGLDGLASSVTSIVALFFALVSRGGASAASAAVCGACLGFLVFNRHPAKLFMGDTGSLALGGALAAIAVCGSNTLFLPLAGGIYVLEALSVIIQVIVFKTQHGRRFFRMAPIHHHFELGGWKESKVVIVFDFISLALCALSLLGAA